MRSKEPNKQRIHHYRHQITNSILRLFRLPQHQRINTGWQSHTFLHYFVLHHTWYIKYICYCNQHWSWRTPWNEPFPGPKSTSKLFISIIITIGTWGFKGFPTNSCPFCHWKNSRKQWLSPYYKVASGKPQSPKFHLNLCRINSNKQFHCWN